MQSSHLTHLSYHTLFHVVFQEEHYKLLSDDGEQKKLPEAAGNTVLLFKK